MKKTYYKIIAAMSLSLIVIMVLYLLSDNLNHQRNNFTRLFPPHPVSFVKAFPLKNDSYYFAGATKTHIYLSSVLKPLDVFILNTSTIDTAESKIFIKNSKLPRSTQTRVSVDSPYFYVTNGKMPIVFKGPISRWEAEHFMPTATFFVESVPISRTSFAVKSINVAGENMLGKITTDSPYYRFDRSILKKQVDGLFCTDGMLHYNSALKQLMYVYRYRNQYICMDTNLNILFKGKTIDTISHAKINVASISSDKSITMSSPPLTVNKLSCVHGNWLFVNSNLLAKNESKKIFNEAAVIDVYNLNNKLYEFSFYLYDYGGKKLSDLKVINSRLVAIYGSNMVVYNLTPKYFSGKN